MAKSRKAKAAPNVTRSMVRAADVQRHKAVQPDQPQSKKPKTRR